MILLYERMEDIPASTVLICLHEEPDEHGQGKWEGKEEGKSDKRITESKAQQKESTTLCINLAY
jgi:hypothetical protein